MDLFDDLAQELISILEESLLSEYETTFDFPDCEWQLSMIKVEKMRGAYESQRFIELV